MSEKWKLSVLELDQLTRQYNARFFDKNYQPKESHEYEFIIAHAAQKKLWDWQEAPCLDHPSPFQFVNFHPAVARKHCKECQNLLFQYFGLSGGK